MSLTKIMTFFKVLLIVVLVIAVCGCTSPITIGRKTSDAINVYPAMVELPVGETLMLQILTGSGSEENMDVEWNSSDEQIATVSEDGRVTAIAAGEALWTYLLPVMKDGKSPAGSVSKRRMGPYCYFQLMIWAMVSKTAHPDHRLIPVLRIFPAEVRLREKVRLLTHLGNHRGKQDRATKQGRVSQSRAKQGRARWMSRSLWSRNPEAVFPMGEVPRLTNTSGRSASMILLKKMWEIR